MMDQLSATQTLMVGVGLRHPHYNDILADHAALDFIEVHSENFFGQGGAALNLLEQVRNCLQVSLHSTALGVASRADIPDSYLSNLLSLSQRIDPFLMSDHACFSWGYQHNRLLSAGDLLPIAHNEQTLLHMVDNINRVQDILGRPLIIENVSAYVRMPGSIMTEAEFLAALIEKTSGKLLLDINNIAVSATNEKAEDHLAYISTYLNCLPTDVVGEYHLAGCTPVPADSILVDDHAAQVSDTVWQGYEMALARFGAAPTLIEWDNNIPEWSVLVAEAEKARQLGLSVLQSTHAQCTTSAEGAGQ